MVAVRIICDTFFFYKINKSIGFGLFSWKSFYTEKIIEKFNKVIYNFFTEMNVLLGPFHPVIRLHYLQ